jgi:hypothetical protein
MLDFRLGDRVMWVTRKEMGIVTDLLDYEGGDKGLIGVLLNSTKQIHHISAKECTLHEKLPTSWKDGLDPQDIYYIEVEGRFPPNDYY